MTSSPAVPDIQLAGTDGPRRLRPKDAGRLVVCFYQEDSTPACSTQLTAFKEDFSILQELGAEIVAISTDGLDAHGAFLARLAGLPFPLLSDPDGQAARAFGVWDADARRSRRAIFVIDDGGRILHAQNPYNPSNLNQYEAVFRALGLSDSSA